MSLSDRLERLVATTVDARPVALTRIVVGCVALVLALADGLTIMSVFSEPGARFPYVPLVTAPPGSAWQALLVAWAVAAVAFAAGWMTRLSGGFLALTIAYAMVLDGQTYANHLYLTVLVVALLVLADSGRRWSVDALLGRGGRVVPGWPVFLLRAQLSIVYGYAAIAKLNPSFLSGEVIAAEVRRLGTADVPAWLGRPEMIGLAVASVLAEAFLAVAFWLPRWRRVGLVVGVGLHGGMIATMGETFPLQIAAFAVLMFAMYIPAWTERQAAGGGLQADSHRTTDVGELDNRHDTNHAAHSS